MVANHVTIFFQGHDHLFARQELDRVICQELPNPTGNTYTSQAIEPRQVEALARHRLRQGRCAAEVFPRIRPAYAAS